MVDATIRQGNFLCSGRTVEEGKKVMDILAAYEAFQLQNIVKPDYVNAGGIEMWNEEDKEWNDWYMETEMIS